MNPRLTLPALILLSACTLTVHSSDLTLEQIESLKNQAKALKENLDAHLSSRNSGAGERFSAAASDPKAAIALYLDCHKLVHYDREGRPESDFRAWREGQEDRLKSPENIESLQMQLHYLALSCRAAETEKIDTIFAPLLNYVDGLSRMQELPTNDLTSSVAGSVFAEAYYLKNLLGNNPGWEAVPFNIGGIYEKTILPHLRKEKPEALMQAWDKRIEQQSRIVQMIDLHRQEALRGLNRDEERRARGNQNGQGGVMKDLDIDDYKARTLPRLQWGKLKDMFNFVSELDGAQAMLPFLKEHLTHELGEEFFGEFNQLIEDASIGSNRLPGSASQ